MPKYLVKLIPVERFFFGGDQTFGENNVNNYFVRSLYFPQQSTLLGMLRYYFLQEKGWLRKSNSATEVIRLIGNKGFDAGQPGKFGIIDGLWPVFITGPDGSYIAQSREFALHWPEDGVTGEKMPELFNLSSQKTASHWHFREISSKSVFPDLLVNATTGRMRFFNRNDGLKYGLDTGVFIPYHQVGNRKKLQKKVLVTESDEKENTSKNEKGFYKQIGYIMPEGFGFSFFVELNTSIRQELKTGWVKMGADESWFRIEFINEDEIDRNWDDLTRNPFNTINPPENKIVMLSDTLIVRPEIIFKGVRFISSDTQTFRYFNTTAFSDKNTSGFQLERAGIVLEKSLKTYTLLKKGSVIFVDKNIKPEILNAIHGEDNSIVDYTEQEKLQINAFKQIGYNYAI